MPESTTLLILLLQLLALALVVCAVLGWWVWRLRQQCVRLMSACRRLKSARPPVRREPPPDTEENAQPAALDWRALSQKSLERYQQLTGKSLGDYAQDDPFSARIASVRYHYLQAEDEAAQAGTEQRAWLTLEKRLAQLITVLLNNAKPVEAHEPDQVALLRQRVKALRKVEDDNKQLQRENSAFAKQVEKLGGYRQKYQALMQQLGEGVTPAELSSLAQSQKSHKAAVEQLTQRVEKEHAAVYRDKKPLLGHIAELSDIARDSDQCIDEILQESQQQAQLALMEQLRRNNRVQRQTIVQLRKELQCLRRALEEQSEAGDSAEVQRLEKLVRETETCVATLESEVDYLHDKLAQRHLEQTGESDPVVVQLKFFAANVVLQTSVQDIAALLARVFANLQWRAAFYLSHDSGRSLHNFSGIEDAHISSMLQAAKAEESPVHSDTGLFFAQASLRVFFSNQMADTVEQEHLLERLGFIAALVDLQLEHLTDLQNLSGYQQHVAQFVSSVKESVANIEIQYAYGTEQARSLVNNLIIELRQLVAASEIEPELREVFETAISEASERFSLLLQSGGVVDGEIAKLAETLDELEKK
ncbi:hypothetical protein [Gilvimarinus sp. DA14]|uniref:hypothetical protein n=1 Tax=Gilvimarinus sp. DA14 TaxID=2956798 RepID=UPI0020B6AD7C|nr:hypothetical protein [Gilvimarinus sp. DA14]UTF58755.1 hypothetical protein NHM04_09715 [Gilvimarinus sp. DA14]